MDRNRNFSLTNIIKIVIHQLLNNAWKTGFLFFYINFNKCFSREVKIKCESCLSQKFGKRKINLAFNHHNIDIFDVIFPNKRSTIIDFQNFKNPVKDKLSAHFSRYTFSYNTVCFKLENIVSTLRHSKRFP